MRGREGRGEGEGEEGWEEGEEGREGGKEGAGGGRGKKKGEGGQKGNFGRATRAILRREEGGKGWEGEKPTPCPPPHTKSMQIISGMAFIQSKRYIGTEII